MKLSRSIPAAALLWLAAALPCTAAPEERAFMNGVLHPALAPAQWLAIAAAALWAGQSGESGARRFLAGVLAGGGAAILLHETGLRVPAGPAQTCLLALIALHGAATALKLKAPGVLAVISGALVAALVTTRTLAEEAMEWSDPLVFGAGNLAGILLLALLAAGIARGLAAGKPWQAIAVRIAGSWLLAIAMLMLALPAR